MSIRAIQSVLYVDDDPDICEVVLATLCLMAGLDVYTATSGEQAFALACELKPDLVLMDVMMPGLDGPATLQRMRASAALANIPVIFMTAKVLPAEIDRFLQLGAIGVIGKPFDPLRLGDDVFALWKAADKARGIKNNQETVLQVQSEVSSLTDSFLKRTSNDVVRLRKMIVRASQGESSAFEEMERLAHSIHGAGAMFGFPGVSAAGGAMERLVEELSANEADIALPKKESLLKSLLDSTEQLAHALESARQSAPNRTGILQG